MTLKLTKNGNSRGVIIPIGELKRLGSYDDEIILGDFAPYRPIFEQILVDACKKKQEVILTLRDSKQTKITGRVVEASQVHCITHNSKTDHGTQTSFSLISSIELSGQVAADDNKLQVTS